MKQRQKEREEAAKAAEMSEIKEEEASTEAKIEETKDEGEPEVSSK
jgi:cell division protein FtsB